MFRLFQRLFLFTEIYFCKIYFGPFSLSARAASLQQFACALPKNIVWTRAPIFCSDIACTKRRFCPREHLYPALSGQTNKQIFQKDLPPAPYARRGGRLSRIAGRLHNGGLSRRSRSHRAAAPAHGTAALRKNYFFFSSRARYSCVSALYARAPVHLGSCSKIGLP